MKGWAENSKGMGQERNGANLEGGTREKRKEREEK